MTWNNAGKWTFAEAEALGRRDGRNGKSPEDNPYIGEELRAFWRRGWESGRRELQVEIVNNTDAI